MAAGLLVIILSRYPRNVRHISDLQTLADGLDAAEEGFAFDGDELYSEGAVANLDVRDGLSRGDQFGGQGELGGCGFVLKGDVEDVPGIVGRGGRCRRRISGEGPPTFG